MCLNIDETLEAALDTWMTAGDVKKTVLGDTRTGLLFGVSPEQAFDYSTIYDTIDYTVSGAFLDWMAHLEPIGLDLTTLDFEMAFSHLTGGNVYNPELLEMEVKGYRTAMRTITAFAVRNSDTPTTSDQFEAYTESGGDAVAYVTPGNDAPRSTDDELSFTSDDDLNLESNDSGTPVSRTSQAVTLASGTTELTFEVTESDLHSLGFHLHADRAVADLGVVDPGGEVVGEFEAVTDERAGGKCCGLPEFSTTDPAAGEWTVRVDNRRDTPQSAEYARWTLPASGENPDPNTAWDGEGFVQGEYDVTPFRFFEDYEEFIVDGGTIDAVTVEDVANGALVDDSGAPAYVMLTSALGWEQVRDTGQTTHRYGRGDQWGTSDVEHLNPPGVSASGSREDDGTTFTGGQTNRVEITVSRLSQGARIYDRVPSGWNVHVGDGDARAVEDRGGTTFVDLGTLDPIGSEGAGETRTYFAEAPSGAGNSGEYTFGPARAETGESGTDFAGTDTNYVVGADQEAPVESTTDTGTATNAGSDAGAGGSGTTGAGDATDGVVDTATDALDD